MATLAELSAPLETRMAEAGSSTGPNTAPLSGVESQLPPPAEGGAPSFAEEPYRHTAPPETIYPDGAVPNPKADSRKEPPGCDNLPPGALYRPKLLPADFDDRLDVESIWMGLQKGTNKAVYFLPQACSRCANNARFCDRSLPTCTACQGRNDEGCKPGKMWATLRPRPKPRISKATNYSAMPIPQYGPYGIHPEPPAERVPPAPPAKGQGLVPISLEVTPPTAHVELPPVQPSPNGQIGSYAAAPVSLPVQASARPTAHVHSVVPIPTPPAPLAGASPYPAASPIREGHSDHLYRLLQPQPAADPLPRPGLIPPGVTVPFVAGSVMPTVSASGSPARMVTANGMHDRTASNGDIESPSRSVAQLNSSIDARYDQALTEALSVQERAQTAVPTIEDNARASLPPPTALAAVKNMLNGSASLHTPITAADRTSPPLPSPATKVHSASLRIRASDDEADSPAGEERASKKRRLTTGSGGGSKTGTDVAAAAVPATTLSVKKRAVRISHVQPASLTAVTYPDAPLSTAEEVYNAALERNVQRPALKRMKHACPVWAHTRMGMQSSTDYFRSPRRTAGGSVEIGLGGVARGVILEGEAPSNRYLWGAGKDIGTLIVPFGKPRPSRRFVASATEEEPDPGYPLAPGPSSPKINILPDVRMVDPKTGDASVVGAKDAASGPSRASFQDPEEDCVEALLVAQRAATPIAIAVTKDYSLFPYQVPRAICGLGWFWVVDAWTESHDIISPDEACNVQWMFRFEFCNGNSRLPWWQEEDERTERVFLRTLPSAPAKGSPISGPGVHGSTTIREAGAEWRMAVGSLVSYPCSRCQHVFTRVLHGETVCFNEFCEGFMMATDQPFNMGAPYPKLAANPRPMSIQPRFYVEPTTLGLSLRGIKLQMPVVSPVAGEHGKDLWRGWICDKCGMANERKRWRGWDCDGCGNLKTFARSLIQLSNVRNPHRPICTGPRPDNGFPSFPYDVLSSWSLFDGTPVSNDPIGNGHFGTGGSVDPSKACLKVVKHVLPLTTRSLRTRGTMDLTGSTDAAESGTAGIVYQALHSSAAVSGKVSPGEVLSRIWRDFQAQGPYSMQFKRNLLIRVSTRAFERYLCPYYTEAFGPQMPSLTDALPAETAMPWKDTWEPVLDLMDYINFRAGTMFADIPEFNSLLLLATPPASVNAYQPKFTVQKSDYLVLTCLGSECTIKIRRSCKGKAAELIMQHGDVLGVQAVEEDIELELKPDGFGFIGIARQAYRTSPEPGLGAVWDPKKPETWRAMQAQQAAEEEADAMAAAADGGLGLLLGEKEPADDGANGTRVDGDAGNLPPPVPTTHRENPWFDWYIGPRPLDEGRKERRGRAMFDRPPEEDSEDEDDGTPEGQIGIEEPARDAAAGPATVGAASPVPGAVAGDQGGSERPASDHRDDESVYDEDPPSPILIRAEIPPSPTSTAVEDGFDGATIAAEEQAAADALAKEKKAKRRKRVSEPGPVASKVDPSAPAEGTSDNARSEKKQKRMSEPAPRDSTSAVSTLVTKKRRGREVGGVEAGASQTAKVQLIDKGKVGSKEKGKEPEKRRHVEEDSGKSRKKAKAEPTHGTVNGSSGAGSAVQQPRKGATGPSKGRASDVQSQAKAPAAASSPATGDKQAKARDKKKKSRKRGYEVSGAPADDAPTPGSSVSATATATPTATASDGGTPMKIKLNVPRPSEAASNTHGPRPSPLAARQ